MLAIPVLARPEVVDLYLDGYDELATLMDHGEGDSRIVNGIQAALDTQHGDELYKVRLTLPLLDMVEINLVDTLHGALVNPSVIDIFERYGELPKETQRCVSLLGRIAQYKEATES